MRYAFHFDVIANNLGLLLAGIKATVLVAAAALAVGLVVGLVVALGRMSKRRWLYGPATAYVEVLRNTPALVQIIWVYYCLPILTGINLSAPVAATIALAANGAATIADIIRGGVQSVDRGQVEAARTLGMSHVQALRTIVLPQALRRMIPPFLNESVALVKLSSLVSVLGVAELTYQGRLLSMTTLRPLEIFTFIALVYFVVCSLMAQAARLLAVRLATSD